MSIIYGLRQVGTDEIRYVGLTNFSLRKRFAEHQSKARGKWHYEPAPWMRSTGNVEPVILQTCAMSKARIAERRWVERLAREGHRLLNSHLVPRQTGAAA